MKFVPSVVNPGAPEQSVEVLPSYKVARRIRTLAFGGLINPTVHDASMFAGNRQILLAPEASLLALPNKLHVGPNFLLFGSIVGRMPTMSDESARPDERAFLLAAEPSRYFPASAVEEARRRIARCVQRDEGAALLIGGAGVGKTLLLEVLADQFKPQMSVVSLIGAQLCTRRALLQMILFELGLPFRDMDEGELRLALHEHLKPAGGPPRRLLLLVDEADSLPMRLLEEIRVLTNLSTRGTPLVSIVLAGRAILEERFADPKLDVFAQRLAARCYLSPFRREETHSYVRSQIAAVGDNPDQWFAADALEAIHGASDGVPRLINQLGDQLTWLVEQTGCRPLDAGLVQQAWSDLQQLPAPWDTHVAADNEPGVIEFGELDDQDAYAVEYAVEKIVDDAPPPDLDTFDEYDLDDESDVAADEQPASISIEFARAAHTDDSIKEISDSMDATEQLVAQLDEFEPMDALAPAENNEPTDEGGAANRKAAQDPFAETFDDEEIVIDQYSQFESALLTSSKPVVNLDDQALSNELASGETPGRPHDRSAPGASADPTPQEDDAASPHTPSLQSAMDDALASALGKSVVVAADVSEAPNAAAAESVHDDQPTPQPCVADDPQEFDNGEVPAAPDRQEHADSPNETADGNRSDAASLTLSSSSPGDLLVVEDDGETSAQLVSGRNFRRLFSSLESGEPMNHFEMR